MDKELLLEKYFEKTLTESERIAFEQLLAADEEFAAAFAFEKEVKKAFIHNEKTELKRKLQALEAKKSAKTVPMRWYYAAACVILLAGFSLWIFQGESTDKLYESYYQTYPNVVAPAVRGSQSDDIQSRAFNAYDTGDYGEAEQLFQEIYQTERTDFALFYTGLSQLELQQYEVAQSTFEQFDFSKNNSFTPYFKWYLALAELKTGNAADAKILLEDLSQRDNPMQEMAKELLEEMD